ncbi:MAG: extracellular solute-binding protein [Eubacteriales bacterium]|nr:extracellular solute-binding protein [Eubacteriales bacterium]
MKKRTLAMLLSGVMALSALAGCSSTADEGTAEAAKTGDNGETETTQDGLIPVTFSRTQDSTMESDIFAKMEGATYDDNLWTDLIAERLGYDIQYLWIASSGDLQTQKFNAAVAAGTIPDIVQVDKTTLKQLVEADLVVDIKPYFDEYASDFVKELIGSAGDACITAATYDGVQYGIPFVDCDLESAQMIWLRQDWMDELGLQAPKTLDDLKEILKKFQEHAGAGSIGLALGENLYGNFFDIKGWSNAYGAYPQYWVDDGTGKLVYGSTTPEMKEALGGLAELFEEGLINPEFYVNDDEKTKEALVNGKCGALYGYHATALYPLQDVIDADPEADFRPYALPMLNADDTVSPGINMVTSSWFAVSKNCEHPEALIELLNLYCEKVLDPEKNEYSVYANPGNGLEGVWRLSPVTINSPNKNQVTAKAIAEPLKTGDPGDLSGEQYSMWEYSYAALNGDKTLWGWNRVFGENGSQQLLISYQEGGDTNLVYDQFTGAPGPVMSSKKSTLDDMLDQTFIKIIAGQESLDAFDTVVENWKSAGGDDMTAEVNEWYASNQK